MIPINDLSRGYNLYRDEYNSKVIEVLEKGWYVLGTEVENFENHFAERFNETIYAAGVDNGLNAIHIGLIAAGINPGDEILVQANGYIATMLGIMQCGAIPVFTEPNQYFNMDVTQLEKALTNRTKAVLVTHLYGQATEMDEISEFCHSKGLMLFEDCAQAHFAKYKDKFCGSFGDASFFSFYPTKNLGAFGDGGAVVSKSKELIDRVKVLRNYGSDRRYHNIVEGYNSRLDEIQAALLNVKLKHYDELVDCRRRIAGIYMSEISNKLVTLPGIAPKCTHIWYQFVLRVGNRESFRQHMRNCGVATDVNWEVPPYLQPAMKRFGHKRGDYPVTEKLCSEIISIPMMDGMTDDEIKTVVDAVNKYE